MERTRNFDTPVFLTIDPSSRELIISTNRGDAKVVPLNTQRIIHALRLGKMIKVLITEVHLD
jgi:hypothetical protein